MNDQAQNAFLKTLEEPPAETTLILIAASMDKLLPTIRSRCSKVQFAPLPVDLVAQRVQQERRLDPQTAALAAVMAGGSLGRALSLDVEGLAHRKEILTRFEALRPEELLPVLRFAEEYGGSREDAEQALILLALWTRDVALLKAGGEGLANLDMKELARETAARLSEAELHRRGSLIDRAQAAIARNGSPRLQLERMLLELLMREVR
jgi:DNA polymerase-3 subunit delta'